MIARYLKHDVLSLLRENVSSNLDRYRSGNFGHLTGDNANFFDGGFDLDESLLSSIRLPTAASDHEAENCEICFKAIEAMSPYEARDERFWAYVTHTYLLDYTRARWPIPSDNLLAIPYIQSHFFAASKRSIERDNSASRLWWMAHLCHRAKGLSLKDSLQVFLFRADVRANIIERPTLCQNTQVFGALLKELKSSFEGDQSLFDRDRFRAMMVDLNSIGGATLLDAMSEAQTAAIIKTAVADLETKQLSPKKAAGGVKPTLDRDSVDKTGEGGSPTRRARSTVKKSVAARAKKARDAKARAKKAKMATRPAESAKPTSPPALTTKTTRVSKAKLKAKRRPTKR